VWLGHTQELQSELGVGRADAAADRRAIETPHEETLDSLHEEQRRLQFARDLVLPLQAASEGVLARTAARTVTQVRGRAGLGQTHTGSGSRSAIPQAARGRARPPCRHSKNQSCFCLGSAFEVAAFQTLSVSPSVAPWLPADTGAAVACRWRRRGSRVRTRRCSWSGPPCKNGWAALMCSCCASPPPSRVCVWGVCVFCLSLAMAAWSRACHTGWSWPPCATHGLSPSAEP
jgi:hypothetical protein